MCIGNPNDEYKDVSEGIRHWQNMRFAQLTVFIAITAGIFAATYNSDFEIPATIKLFLKIGGIAMVSMFWLMDERVVQYWHASRNRAIELEKILNYAQYTTNPPRGRLTAGNAIRLFYMLQMVFWVITILCPN